MKVILKKKPKNATIIEGFPGFGLVGTITTEYLVNELKAKLIGTIQSNELPPMAAIHDSKVVEPAGIYYDKKNNLIILHIMTNVKGIEWEIGKSLLAAAKDLNAKEIISVEGVGTPMPSKDAKVYSFTNTDSAKKKFATSKIEPLKEGIILGVTATILLQADNFPVSAVFVETQSNLPDSKAAAKAIETIDKYLNLKIDYKPLLKQAEKFENKIKGVMEQSNVAQQEQMKKTLNYVG